MKSRHPQARSAPIDGRHAVIVAEAGAIDAESFAPADDVLDGLGEGGDETGFGAAEIELRDDEFDDQAAELLCVVFVQDARWVLDQDSGCIGLQTGNYYVNKAWEGLGDDDPDIDIDDFEVLDGNDLGEAAEEFELYIK